MARSQIRLRALTGSLVDVVFSGSLSSANQASKIAAPSGEAVFGELAGAIARLNGMGGTGATGALNQEKGHFGHGSSDYNFHVTGSHLSFSKAAEVKTDVGNLAVNAAGQIQIGSDDVAQNIVIGADGARTINIGDKADGNTVAINIKAAGADGSDVSIESAAGSVNLASNQAVADAIKLNAADAAGGVQILGGTGGLDFDFTAAGDGSGNGAVTMDAGAGISLDAAAASNFSTSAGALTLAGASLDVDATAGAFNIAGTAQSTVTTSGGELVLDGQTGVFIQEDGQNVIEITTDRDLLLGAGPTSLTRVLGDLDVQGTTTTIESTQVNISDRMIQIASGSTSAGQTSAIAFASGSAANTATLIGNASADLIAVAKMDVLDGAATPNFSSLIDFRANTLQVAGAGNNLAVGSNGLIITSVDALTASVGSSLTIDAGSDIKLDSDSGIWEFADGGTTRLAILKESGDDDVIIETPVADHDLIFAVNDADGGGANQEVFRVVGATQSVLFDTDNKLNFRDSGISVFSAENGALDIQADAVGVRIAAPFLSVQDNDDSGPAVVRLLEDSSNGTNFISLKAPNALADDTTVFQLPSNNGTNGQALVTNGAGVLSYADIGSAAREKAVLSITADIADQTPTIALDGSTANVTLSQGSVDISSTQNAVVFKQLEVYVNGQLMVSGSANDYTSAKGGGGSNGSLTFTFGLELGDTISVVNNA